MGKCKCDKPRPKPKPCPRPDESTLVNRTVFVDEKFGDNETGRVEDSHFPVKTLKRAFRLIKENRRSVTEIWNIVVRPGNYKIKKPVPDNVAIAGSGLSTVLVGQLIVRGNAQFAAFRLIGTAFPCIEVAIRAPVANANVLFEAVDVSLSSRIRRIGAPVILNPVKLNSNAVASVVVFQNSRFVFDYAALPLTAETEAFVVGNLRLELFTCFVRAIVNFAVKNTLIVNNLGDADIELGTYIYESSSPAFLAPAVFIHSRSSKMTLNKDSRFVVESTSPVADISGDPARLPLPFGLINYLGDGNSQIESANLVTVITDKVQQQNRFIAFAQSLQTKINVQSLQSLISVPGNVKGNPLIPNLKDRISSTTIGQGNNTSSGAPAISRLTLEAGSPSIVDIPRELAYIRVNSDAPATLLRLPSPDDQSLSNINNGYTVNISPFNNNTRVLVPGTFPPGEVFLPAGAGMQAKLVAEEGKPRLWETKFYPVSETPVTP